MAEKAGLLPQKVTELEAGEFNAAYKIDTAGGSYVLKVAPGKSTPVLRYEKGMMQTEVAMLKRYANVAGLRTPRLVYFGGGEEESAFFVMEYLRAQAMNTQKLSRTQHDDVMRALGRVLAEAHKQTSLAGYGYEQMGLAQNWYEAYTGMVRAIVQDAADLGVRVPHAAKVLALAKKYESVLGEVKPRLVHFDVWTGNIFLQDKQFFALIDMERAMWGDMFGDFISLDFVRDVDHKSNAALVRGYNEVADEPLVFDAKAKVRLGFMRAYLGMIMFTEVETRLPKGSPYFYVRRGLGRYMLNWGLRQIKEADDNRIKK